MKMRILWPNCLKGERLESSRDSDCGWSVAPPEGGAGRKTRGIIARLPAAGSKMCPVTGEPGIKSGAFSGALGHDAHKKSWLSGMCGWERS